MLNGLGGLEEAVAGGAGLILLRGVLVLVEWEAKRDGYWDTDFAALGSLLVDVCREAFLAEDMTALNAPVTIRHSRAFQRSREWDLHQSSSEPTEHHDRARKQLDRTFLAH